MSLSGDDYDLLERKFAMYVLVAVSENPHSTKTQIMRLEEGNERTKYQRLRELSDAGYIEYVRSDNYAGERMVLSRDAEEIVSYLNKIRSVMARRKPQNDNKDVPERRGGSAVQAEDRQQPLHAPHLDRPSHGQEDGHPVPVEHDEDVGAGEGREHERPVGTVALPVLEEQREPP